MSIASDDDRMFLPPDEMNGDLLDNSEEDLLRPMLQEWLHVVRALKIERHATEQRLRETLLVQRAQLYRQSKKLMVAVTYNKWREYMDLAKVEKRELAVLQKEASANMAKAKLAPTKQMVQRRSSVMGGGGRSGRSPRNMDSGHR